MKPILKVSEDCYEFHFPNGFFYDVEKWRCNTERDLNEWIAHLSRKNWWSKELEENFIDSYKKEHGKS